MSGGGSFRAAATLPGSGNYTDTLQSGEYVFYRVRLDWGQGLAYRVRFAETGGANSTAASNVETALYSPLGPGAAAMPDSVGLSKGLIALTHLYGDAAAAGSNQVVLVHEVLHTLGATDKYDFATGQPLAPEGLGEQDRQPLYPQDFGEIMAGRIAISARDAVVAASLEQMLVSPVTALEIGWPP